MTAEVVNWSFFNAGHNTDSEMGLWKKSCCLKKVVFFMSSSPFAWRSSGRRKFMSQSMDSASGKALVSASSKGGSAQDNKREDSPMIDFLKKFLKDEEGLDLRECALLLVFLVGIVEEVREG